MTKFAFNQIIKLWDHVKRDDDPVTLTDDPVALACCSFRMSQALNTRWYSFEHCDVQEQDRLMAQELKTYYRSRTQDVLFAMLGNSGASPAVSSFRRKLRLLVTEGLMITARDIGLLYRLPYLYAEDQALDLVVSQTQSAASGELSAKKQVCLQPLTKYLRSRRANEVMQYWWKGIDDDQAYTLAVKKDNPLISLMDDLWKDGNLDLSFHGVVATVKGYHNNFYFTRILEPRLSPCLVN